MCAFSVVVGTLVIQGFTLRPLIVALKFKDDREVEQEIRQTYARLAQVALDVLDGDRSAESQELRREFKSLLDGDDEDSATGRSRHDRLRSRIIAEQRRVLLQMRHSAEIGDDAFHRVEERLDWAELSARGATGKWLFKPQ